VVLEQLNAVAGSLQDGERDLSTRYSGHFAGQITCMMRPMRKLEAQNILPKSQRPLKVRDGEAGVIGRDDAK